MIEDHSTGDIACDSINHVKTDVKMIKDLGVDFYRFSIAWTRILPNGFSNEINQKGVDYYNSLIDELIENNITPIVTIYHWDLPQRFQDLGGWTNEVMVEYFKDYAEVLFRLFGDRVKTWLSFNEPKEICYYGYGEDSFAPALKYQGVAEYLCVHTFLKSHAEVYHLYHEKFNQDRTGNYYFFFIL